MRKCLRAAARFAGKIPDRRRRARASHAAAADEEAHRDVGPVDELARDAAARRGPVLRVGAHGGDARRRLIWSWRKGLLPPSRRCAVVGINPARPRYAGDQTAAPASASALCRAGCPGCNTLRPNGQRRLPRAAACKKHRCDAGTEVGQPSQSWAIESLAARLLPEIMPVTPDDLAQLEERLLAKLQQPSRVEEEDRSACRRVTRG